MTPVRPCSCVLEKITSGQQFPKAEEAFHVLQKDAMPAHGEGVGILVQVPIGEWQSCVASYDPWLSVGNGRGQRGQEFDLRERRGI